MENAIRKIMILGAGEGQLNLIRRAKDAGWYTLVVSPQGNYPGFRLADECLYENISSEEAILGLANEHRIDAIATDQTDVSVPTVQYVSEQLKLPHIECTDIRNFQEKSRMRRICEAAGILTIPFLVTDNASDALRFFEQIGSAVIIKPIDSQGSRGVHKITSVPELYEGFDDAKAYSKSGTVIIEKFIDGQEIEVDSIVYQNELKAVLVGDVYNFDVKDTFSAYERIYPSAFADDVMQRIHDVNETTLRSLGLITGWAHGEYIVERTTNNVYLLEVGARGGGNFIGSDIVRLQLGVGTDEMAFRTSIGDTSFYEECHAPATYCAYKCFYLPEGEVVSLSVDTDYLKKPFVVTHNLQELRPGLKMHKNTDKTSRFTILLQAASRSELQELLVDVPNHVHAEVQTPDNSKKNIIWK